MSKRQWREFFNDTRLTFLRRLEEELGPLLCWECGKELTPETATFLLDHGGIIVWCMDDAIRTMGKVEMWRKILGTKGGHRRA